MVWWQVPGDAMSLLNMNLMRKGPRYWSDSHCFDLLDAALEACEAREHELMPPPKKRRTSAEAALARQVPQARRPTSGCLPRPVRSRQRPVRCNVYLALSSAASPSATGASPSSHENAASTDSFSVPRIDKLIQMIV